MDAQGNKQCPCKLPYPYRKKNKKVIKRLELWQLLTEEKIANS